MAIPARLIGYGAYNLCFDKMFGQKLNPQPSDPDFFTYMKNNYPMINLVKVICFRRSTLEGLPVARAVPLFIKYREQGDIRPPHGGQVVIEFNEAFPPHLAAMVDRAAAIGMWVQVCIFSQQSVSRDEAPENPLPEVNPATMGASVCEKLTNFFSPDPSPRLETQKYIVRRIGSALRGRTKVLWEIANEVRVEGCPDERPINNQVGNCRLAKWLNIMAAELKSAGGYGPSALVGTSTGVGNEGTIFSANRSGVGCAPAQSPALPVSFFDFHSGQWDYAGNFARGIQNAKARSLGYNPSSFLIINDDGSRLLDEDPNNPAHDAELKKAAAKTLNHWALEAFNQRLHFASKQQYPPLMPYDTYALNALRDANNGIYQR